ncbi:hypothetical protein CMV_025552 [Castanea mollissima]|uniref:Uncharacterized protein n=1 Tax=Castanea mollissima TaxID=60419 RepID=A0A8J4QD27_9ROSI|nr:hypothetical protein CMV_025552 [Castanea mollissima]
MFRDNLGMRARILNYLGKKHNRRVQAIGDASKILNCLGVQFPILFAEFVASAFLHNQQLIFKVHVQNKLWVLVDWLCISQLDSTYWRRVVCTGEIVRRGCTSNGHVLHSHTSCY